MQFTPRFYIEQFSTFNEPDLRYKLVAIEQRRLGRHVLLSASHLEKKLDELYSFVLGHIGETLHTIVPDEVIALKCHCHFPGTFDYELCIITTQYTTYHVFFCFETKQLMFRQREVPHVEERLTTLSTQS